MRTIEATLERVASNPQEPLLRRAVTLRFLAQASLSRRAEAFQLIDAAIAESDPSESSKTKSLKRKFFVSKAKAQARVDASQLERNVHFASAYSALRHLLERLQSEQELEAEAQGVSLTVARSAKTSWLAQLTERLEVVASGACSDVPVAALHSYALLCKIAEFDGAAVVRQLAPMLPSAATAAAPAAPSPQRAAGSGVASTVAGVVASATGHPEKLTLSLADSSTRSAFLQLAQILFSNVRSPSDANLAPFVDVSFQLLGDADTRVFLLAGLAIATRSWAEFLIPSNGLGLPAVAAPSTPGTSAAPSASPSVQLSTPTRPSGSAPTPKTTPLSSQASAQAPAQQLQPAHPATPASYFADRCAEIVERGSGAAQHQALRTLATVAELFWTRPAQGGSDSSVHPFSVLFDSSLKKIFFVSCIFLRTQLYRLVILAGSESFLSSMRETIFDEIALSDLWAPQQQLCAAAIQRRLAACPDLAHLLLPFLTDLYCSIPHRLQPEVLHQVWTSLLHSALTATTTPTVPAGKRPPRERAVNSMQQILVSILRVLDSAPAQGPEKSQSASPGAGVSARSQKTQASIALKQLAYEFLGEHLWDLLPVQTERIDDPSADPLTALQNEIGPVATSLVLRLERATLFSPMLTRAAALRSLASIGFRSDSLELKSHVFAFLHSVHSQPQLCLGLLATPLLRVYEQIFFGIDLLVKIAAEGPEVSLADLENVFELHLYLCKIIATFSPSIPLSFLPLGSLSRPYVAAAHQHRFGTAT
eukprot:TRINITY_DN3726_c0_g1_i1.p1 TRINITY_DN3726_c0_g1~~TRINITY_DN3726_c0_g1_i1.p1  ORF type:complete len:874 (-),score=195.36 TRINITY_DN3726_c0_g1_i1:30-2321(-)